MTRNDQRKSSIAASTTKRTIFERAGRGIGEAVVARPWTTLLVGLVAFVVVSFGLTTARFSTDYRIFFSKDDPGLAAFEHLESTFTKTDNVLFVIKAADDRDGAIFQADPLSAVQELTNIGWTLPYATRVDSLTNFQHPDAKEGDEIVVGALVPGDARTLDADALARVRAAAASEPLLAGSLLARDGRTAAVNVTLRLPGKEPREVTESADAARKAVLAVRRAHPRLDIRASGMAFMNDAFMQASIRDMAVMMPLMVLVMLVGMAFVMRSKLATLAVAAVIGVSAAMSMAVAGWLHYPLTPPAVAAPMIVLTVAVADGVHIVLAAMEAMREGHTRAQAIVLSLEKNLEAITYTWLTTIVGFVCLNYSDAPPVTHLANMTSFGVTAAFVYSFTVLPALLVVLPVVAHRAPTPSGATGEAEERVTLMARVAAFVVRRRIPLLAATVVVTVIGGWQASRLETNDQFVRYFDQSIPFRRDVDFTMKNLSGIYRLEYQIASDGPSGVAEPAYLRTLDDFGGWLRAQPEVEHVYGIADVVKRVNQVMGDGSVASYRIPDSRAAVSEALLVYEMGLPQGLDLTDRVNVDKSAARLTVTVKDVSSQQMNAFTARSERWLRDHAPKAMWAEATGPVVIFSQLGDRNAKSMVQGDFVSLALISLCMIIVLRSLRLGLLSVLPNVIPIVVGYGLWRVFVGQMNIVASVAGSISLGIIVDDTIHFLTRYKAMKQKGLDAETAMTKTLTHVGPAMLGTSVILVLGFGVLTLSSFQMTSYLGWLSVIIVAVAPLTDLVLAPALVLLFVREPRLTKPRTHAEGTSIMKTAASFILGLFTLAVTVTAATDANARTSEEILAAGSPEAKGQAVALELAARNAGYKDLGGDVEMTLRDAGGGEAKRRFSLKVLERPVPTAGDYSLIVFDAPADVKGTAVLSHAKVGDDDEQWLYLPSAHRTRRISSSNRTGAFAGSEFSFEDLTGNDGRKYDWRLTATEACGALTCFVVDAIPKDPASAYSKRVLRIDTQEFRIQSIEFFDRKNAKLKTLAYESYKKLGDRFWRSQSWTMKNHQSGKSTVISFSSMKVGNGFTVNDFATGKLGS